MSVKVSAWLKDLGLDQYSNLFEDNAIEWDLLPELDQAALKELGVDSVGHRLRILKSIAEFTTPVPPSPNKAADPDSISGTGSTRDEIVTWARTPGERKPVTMLFADVVDSTALTEKLDAEEAHDLLYRATQHMCAAIEANAGTVCRFMGDGVMAMFGAPVASERHSLEACQAALDMQQAIAAYSKQLEFGHGAGLQIRVGLNSGEVVVLEVGDDPERPEYDASGPTVPLAARMEQSATPGGIQLTESTRILAGDQALVEERPAIQAKGITAPIEVFELTGIKSFSDTTTEQARQPFIGRRVELSQVRSLLDICQEDNIGQIVVVRGDPGIGKSRFAEEVSIAAGNIGYQCHKALVLDFGIGKGQEAVPSIARSLVGVSHGSNKRERLEALDRAINHGLVGSDQRVFMHDLLDLRQPLELRTLYDAMDVETRKRGKRQVLRDILYQLSQRQPILIVIEDLHWADEITLDHLSTLGSIASENPVVFLMTSRIEGNPIDTDWRSSVGETPIFTLDLKPLREDECLQLVGQFIDASDSLAQQCVRRAAGNPLFLRQLLLNISKGGDDTVPDSIKSIVLARIDQLPGKDNQALKAASALGQRFQLEVLRDLIDDPDFDCATLIAHQLVRRDDQQYLFAHALIQEAAYTSLLKAQRISWHGRAARWYRDKDLVLHAEHLGHADDESAPQAFLKAARDQLANFRPEKALQLVHMGQDIATEIDRFELTCNEGELLGILGKTRESVETYRRATKLAGNEHQLCQALAGLAEGLDILGAHEEMIEVIGEAEVLARKNELNLELAQFFRLRSSMHFFKGEQDACLQASKIMLDHARKAESLEMEARALSGIGDAEYMRGRFESGAQYFRRCIEIARENGFGRMIGPNLMMLGYMAHWRNELDIRDQMYVESAELAELTHDLRNSLHTLTGGIWWAEKGDFDTSRERLDHALDIAKKLGSKILEGEVLYLQGLHQFLLGNIDQARRLAHESVSTLERSESGMTFRGPTALAVSALVEDDDTERRSLLQKAEDVLAGGCVAHNYLDFYEIAIQACLRASAWDEADRYANLLQDFTSEEPLARCTFFADLGRVLATHGRGDQGIKVKAELLRLKEQAETIQLLWLLPQLENAIATLN